jgi:hypothetical protein
MRRGTFYRFFERPGHRARGLRNLQVFEKFVEALAVLGEVDRLRRGADDFYARSFQRQR